MADGIDLDAIKRWQELRGEWTGGSDADWHLMFELLPQAVAEVERLRADNERISAAWADVIQREQRGDNAHEYDVQQVEAERDAALARIRAVEALHCNEYGCCQGCTGASAVPWPCPTARALAAPIEDSDQ
jgi:hypothetical protein